MLKKQIQGQNTKKILFETRNLQSTALDFRKDYRLSRKLPFQVNCDLRKTSHRKIPRNLKSATIREIGDKNGKMTCQIVICKWTRKMRPRTIGKQHSSRVIT